MSDRFFESPILNSPYERPARHWQLDAAGQPTNRIVDERRACSLVTPVPKPKKAKGAATQRELALLAGEQAYNPVPIINEVRRHVATWRDLAPRQWQVTAETARLLTHWRSHRFANQRPFFCQIEAVETAIWLTEVAPKRRRQVAAILNHLSVANARGDAEHPELPRLALKLATGAGKTTVMAMLIAWQTINAVRHPSSRHFTRGFLVVTPGITIRDRLRVLLPSDPDSCYAAHELVPADMLGDLAKAQIVITNYHAFMPRETQALSKGGKGFLHGREAAPDTRESAGQMLQRVCPALLGMKQVMAFNDEAHHCYREQPADSEERALKGDERKEAERNTESARVWISGLEHLASKVNLLRVVDLSATPFFLAGSGYREGTLFPWTMSDFSLLDAIECGIVKLPRVPVADNIPNAEMPVYRNLWEHIGKAIPKRRNADPQQLPIHLMNALDALYEHYRRTFEQWEAAGIDTPPCFIVVCNTTTTSKLVHDYIAGYARPTEDGETVVTPGKLPLFRNFTDSGDPLPQSRTLLIDSVQLESGDALDSGFRAAAAHEIERFKDERVLRSGNPADRDSISDADLLREVVNTVGKPGRLGESIRCVVSVAMLTEGWDASTVTHILGVRAFGTQLLCEQVVGRALRRQSYELNDDGRFDVEYADVLGVPFDFTAKPQPVPAPKPAGRVLVEAVSPERDWLEIRFPRVAGYRTELPEGRLGAKFDDNATLDLTPELVGPTRTLNQGLIGEGVTLSPEDPTRRRRATLVYAIARRLLERHWPARRDKPDCFADLHGIVSRWMDECLECKGATTFRHLAWDFVADMACERIMRGIEAFYAGEATAALFDEPSAGSTAGVRFTATRSKTLWRTDFRKCHVNYAVCDSAWEAEFCRVVEAHPRTLAYVKNHGLGLEVPYRFGKEHRYLPDFVVKVLDSDDPDDPLHLVVEIKGKRGERDKTKALEMTARWVWAVNREGGFGRWAFAEFTDVHALESDYKAKMLDLHAKATAKAAKGFKEFLVTGPSFDDLDLTRPKYPQRPVDLS